MIGVKKSDLKLFADNKAVIAQYLHLPGGNRIKNIVERTATLTNEQVIETYKKVRSDFAHRHADIEGIFADHFLKIENVHGELANFSSERKLLLGAFFTKEYSIQSAALFNPSIVAHPNQHGVTDGSVRFIISLRATGEGHISSVVFQTGIIDSNGAIQLDKPSGIYTALKRNEAKIYTREFLEIQSRAKHSFDKNVLNILPESFTAKQAENAFNTTALPSESIDSISDILDSNYDIEASPEIPLTEKVIFPFSKAESMGIEDVRLVRFTEDSGEVKYYGTYTAYNGRNIRSQIFETTDFESFKIRTMYGAAVQDKGMALLPEKVNGSYVMISRQGGETINIMYSTDLYEWDEYSLLLEPTYDWEFVQLGNCGSPIKTDKGWLLLTHGVGAVRTYVISAILLELSNPSKIIGRLTKPLIKADESEREGYVPNVVYTCGLMQHGDLLIIPYAQSDSATGFATIGLQDLLNEMTA